MTDKRLQQIREGLSSYAFPASCTVRELLEEVERLRAELDHVNELFAEINESRDFE